MTRLRTLIVALRAAYYHRMGIGSCPVCDERHRDLYGHIYDDHGDLGWTCNECCEPVAADDTAPSCGTHIIHIGCAAVFPCRECWLTQRDVDWRVVA